MKMSIKNHLLQSVSQVLSECQRILSILSTVNPEDEYQEQDLWWDEDDIKYEVSRSCSSDFSDLSEIDAELEENVVLAKIPSNFWWIPWQGDDEAKGDETNNNFLKLKNEASEFNIQ